jgi:hypothetical protein
LNRRRLAFAIQLWHGAGMAKRSGEKRDFMQIAREVVERAIGEQMDGSPLQDPDAGKNPAAVALGRLGGAKGGAARAKSLSPKRRRAIAKKAADSRWKSKP